MRNRTFLLCTEDGIHELTMVMKRAFDEDAGIYSGKKKEVPQERIIVSSLERER